MGEAIISDNLIENKHIWSLIDAPNGVNSFSIDHNFDVLSGDDMGSNTAFKTNAKKWYLSDAHGNKTFATEVGVFVKAYQKSKGDNKNIINDFVNRMRSRGVKVTVKE